MSENYDFAAVKLRLMIEFGYSEIEADVACQELAGADSRILEAFFYWFETGETGSLVVENYNLERLKNEHGLNTIAGFLTLDWLLQDPQAALESLARGYDTII